MADAAPSRSYAVVVVFALGTIFGAALTVILLHLRGGMPMPFGHHGGVHGPRAEADAMVEHMEHELGLNEAQRARIKEILDDAHDRVHQTLEETHKKIRALLTPEQQEKFDAMRPPELPFPHRGGAPPPP
ncbi:MAG TPA: hypothetical protein VFV19_07105 [Candidatus Polarisedimenticolaceae bacterium]|nr:hypothetical protein [Candidatus Polarisedimenticolaceae bacterium]